MLGAIVGDIIGSSREFNNEKTTTFELFVPKSRFTDDTVCTAAIANAILDGSFDYKTALRELCPLYPQAGYGKKFADWVVGTSDAPYNSWGNGSAMRVSPVAWVAKDLDEALTMAKATADVTHSHPEGVAGAQAVAGAIFLARTGKTKDEIRTWINEKFPTYDLNRKIDDIRPTYRFDVSCRGSVPEAIIAFLESGDFESSIRLGVSIGGDSDTIAAITGSIADAFYGGVPDEIAKTALGLLDSRLRNILIEFLENFR